MSDTPETDAMCICTHHKSFAAIGGVVNPDFARRLERERDEWKQKFIQQNKDLGCEMMDPNGTIWDYAKKLQEENKALQEQLDAAIMLGKMQERRHERDLEELIAAAKAVIDRWETPFWKEAAHTGLYIVALRKAVEITEGRYASESMSAKINVANHQQITNEPERRHDGRREE